MPKTIQLPIVAQSSGASSSGFQNVYASAEADLASFLANPTELAEFQAGYSLLDAVEVTAGVYELVDGDGSSVGNYRKSTNFATSAQGDLADTAVQPDDLTVLDDSVGFVGDGSVSMLRSYQGKLIRWDSSTVGGELEIRLPSGDDAEAFADGGFVTVLLDSDPAVYTYPKFVIDTAGTGNSTLHSILGKTVLNKQYGAVTCVFDEHAGLAGSWTLIGTLSS